MLDKDQNAGHEVWGVWVPRGTNGRLKWLDELKVRIIDRIEAGETIASIAREICANESLVSKWVKDHRDAQSRPVDRIGIVEWSVSRRHIHTMHSRTPA